MMKRNYTPFFPKSSNENFNNTIRKSKNSVSTFYKNNDVYDSKGLAEERSYNLGCSGYRKVLINSKGKFGFSPCSSLDSYKKIMKDLQPINRKREYYEFDPTDNIFDIRDHINDEVKEGYIYKESLMKKTLSNVIFRDPVKESILNEIQKVVFGLIETTKQIKNFFNYTVPKNNRRVF